MWEARSALGTHYHLQVCSFLGDSVVENLPASTGDVGSTPGSGRSPGEGNGNPFQYPCLGNPMDRGALWATVHGVKKESTQLTKQQQQ